MTHGTPDTPDALRAEIASTRADLGDTIEALAAKTDVKARAKDAVGDLADQAKATVGDVRNQALGMVATATDRVSDAATTVADQVRSNAADVRESLADGDVLGAARKPLPIAGLAVAAALVGLVIYLIRRRNA
jgi:ABC-type transporter Mla subunit MlaD